MRNTTMMVALTAVVITTGGQISYPEEKVEKLWDRSHRSIERQPVTAWTPTFARLPSKNPFGLMVGARRLTVQQRMSLVKALGAVYVRPQTACFVETWQGSCPEGDAAKQVGLQLVLTVRNNGGRGKPTIPPQDLLAYQQTVGKILDRHRPALLVVENEENSAALFYTGTPQEYHQQLKAACNVAHQRGIRCTNGGLVSSLVTLLVADHYEASGVSSRADRYRKRSLDPEKYRQYQKAPSSPLVTTQITRGKALLAGYKAAGVDYVNFHWYIADPEALAEAVMYLTQVTGLPAITNEVGQQKNEDPAQVKAIMQKIVELKLPIAVWFSIDVPGYGQARALVDEDGTLRPSGEAFKAFIQEQLPVSE